MLHAPPGYVAAAEGGATIVARTDVLDAVRRAVRDGGTLHAWAAARPGARALQGRAAAYAVALPGSAADVVVRHSWHGGALARLTGDRFLPPTRAPRELATSLALRGAGVRTPEVLAYVVHRAGPLLRRADVATRLVPASRDLAAEIVARAGDAEWLAATGELLEGLADAGARHPDLNLKNVLLAPDDVGALRAWVLDVDVVVMHRPADAGARARIAERNWARLARSLRKWRDTRGLPVREDQITALRETRDER